MTITDLRHRARAWLEANVPAEWRGATAETHGEEEFRKIRWAWGKRLHEGGWLGLSWPKEHGGQGLSLIDEVTFGEEEARAKAPNFINRNSVFYIGPTIIAHGTEAQKRRYLPKILSCEEAWCQGYSEPEAGSDLFALRTSAVRRDGRWIINGQKVWITQGCDADFCYLLARSHPDRPRHLGISAFIVDMRAKGVTARPITTITGSHEFAEVFFEDVEVPDDHVLGELGEGWKVATTTLAYERSTNFFARVNYFYEQVGDVAKLARATQRNGKPAIDDAMIAERLAKSREDAEALRRVIYRHLPAWAENRNPGPESSVIKVMWSEAHQRLLALALDVLGPAAQQRLDRGAIAGGFWPNMYLFARAETIYAGTSEVQRNVIAQRMLGLPKAERPEGGRK
ncbi:MAG: acyl-CoA dehydrogenase family protein [Kofleriaceae bacterium]